MVFRLSSPFPTQCKAAVTTVGSEKPSTFFTVRSTHGLSSSISRLGRDILQSCRTWKLQDIASSFIYTDEADYHLRFSMQSSAVAILNKVTKERSNCASYTIRVKQIIQTLKSILKIDNCNVRLSDT